MRTKETSNSEPAHVPVPEILQTVGHEVRMLSDSVADLQDVIGNLLVAGAFGGSPSLYELQNLDRLCQNLDAVAAFLGGVSKLSSPDWKIDVAAAARGVKIAEVSARLHGFERGEDGQLQSAAGDFEDFEGWASTG